MLRGVTSYHVTSRQTRGVTSCHVTWRLDTWIHDTWRDVITRGIFGPCQMGKVDKIKPNSVSKFALCTLINYFIVMTPLLARMHKCWFGPPRPSSVGSTFKQGGVIGSVLGNHGQTTAIVDKFWTSVVGTEMTKMLFLRPVRLSIVIQSLRRSLVI